MKCEICGESATYNVPYPNGKDILFKDKELSLCRACGSGYVNTSISESDLNQYYSERYNLLDSPFTSMRRDGEDPATFFRSESNLFKPERAKAQVHLVSSYLKKTPKYALDIGAGLGGGLYFIKSIFGEDVKLSAVEPDKTIHKYLSYLGAKVYTSAFELEEKKFDMVYSSHSLEHFNVGDAKRLLKHVKTLLSPGGVFMIEVPFADLVNYEFMIERTHEPHLIFFSKKGLAIFLENAGFKVLFNRKSGNPLNGGISQFLYGNGRRVLEKLGVESLLHYGPGLNCIRAVVTV